MNPVRCILLALALMGCSGGPTDHDRNLTGSGDAVAGFPRHREAGRVEIESCCTFELEQAARSKHIQGIDSVVLDVSGSGYALSVIFGPYDGAQPQSGYRPVGTRIIDGIELTAFRWTVVDRTPPEGRLLWLAQVGGGRIDGMNHTPWGLRITGDCSDPAACRKSAALVETIRF